MENVELFPAQLIFLRSPKKIKVDEIFSYILQDLTLKRVLNLQKIQSFPNERSRKTQKYFMFVKGENYEGYDPQNFEKHFLSPFSELNQIQIKILTNYVLKKYSLPSKFIVKELYAPLHKQKYISAVPFLKSFGVYNLSREGKQAVAELNEFLHEREEKLTALIDGDREEFIRALNETGTYAFLFEHENPELHKNIISMVKRIHRSKPLGPENDLSPFFEAYNIDLGYFEE